MDYSNHSFHKQLVKFHKGDEAAVLADVELVVKYYGDNDINKWMSLSFMFVWDSTAEGWDYWNDRDVELVELVEEEE